MQLIAMKVTTLPWKVFQDREFHERSICTKGESYHWMVQGHVLFSRKKTKHLFFKCNYILQRTYAWFGVEITL